ncbi:diguanylate cyclase [Azospirillum sp.]|uniref:sensor domain-containing diguanylate cyclase n=1 Tax=Azospirillum sp. TaxID=34012 RepID=UPI002D3341F9|nr:diguanylate cyclase [Azospirillum sp.]HYD66977.1 diguanylate cyclase [Azospirillum sp.]
MRYDTCAGLLGALNCGVVLIDADERIVLWNAWMAERSGIPETGAVGRTLAELFPHLADTRIEQAVRMALRSGLPTILSHNLHPRPFPLFTAQPGGSGRRGAPVEQSTMVRPIRPPKPAAGGGAGGTLCLVQVTDVTATVVRENRLREMADYARSLIEASIDPFITIDTKGTITGVNAAAEQVTGLKRDALIGSGFVEHFTQPEQAATGLETALEQGVLRDFPLSMRKGDGPLTELLFNISIYRNPAGEIGGILAAGRDVTKQKAVERELARLATTDTLTGVANRGHFMELAEREIMRAHRYRHPVVLLSLDVDHFKSINDTYGHAAGDETLRRLIAVLRRQLRETDTIGRIGGEEFLILLPETVAADAQAVAERVRLAVAQMAVHAVGHSFTMTVSMGLAALAEGESLQRALVRVDGALYEAKRSGRNRVCVAPV